MKRGKVLIDESSTDDSTAEDEDREEDGTLIPELEELE